MKLIFKLLIISSTLMMTQNAFAYVDRNTQAFLNKLNAQPGKPMEQLSPTDARAVLTDAQKSVQVDLSGVNVQKKTITVDGKSIPLVIIKPANNASQLPVFMFFHGGGWVIGDYPTHERFVRDLVVNSGFAAVFVDYNRSPEVHYPEAINQAYAATKWVAENGNEIKVDGKRLAVVGSSVGGNMAAVVSLMAKNQSGPQIKYQVLFWPVTDANFNTRSYNQFANGYFLTKNMMKWFWDNYTKDAKQRQEIYASPLRATPQQLAGLPSALVITAENDVLSDEGEAYAAKMDAAGVDVTSVRYNGTIHDFCLLNALSNDAATQSAILQAATELRKHL